MSIGTAAAIGLAAYGASQVASAAMQSHAATQAAQTQAAFGQQALGLQQQEYQQAQQRLAPYVQAGQSEIPALQQFLQSTVPRGINSPFGSPTLSGYAGPGGGGPGGMGGGLVLVPSSVGGPAMPGAGMGSGGVGNYGSLANYAGPMTPTPSGVYGNVATPPPLSPYAQQAIR